MQWICVNWKDKDNSYSIVYPIHTGLNRPELAEQEGLVPDYGE